MNLTEISGIGETKAKKFIDLGIETVEDLAQFDDPDYFDFTVKQEWLDQAKALVSEVPQEEVQDEVVEEPTEQEATEDVVEPEADENVPEQISFTLLSGGHKGKPVIWKVGDPAMVVGRSGGYVGLGSISVSAIGTIDGVTRFKFIWGQTVSGAELPESEFKIFSEQVKKNEAPSYSGAMTANGGVAGRVMQGVKQAAANVFGGCGGGCG